VAEESGPGLERAIIDTIREPLLVLDDELRVVLASASFLEAFNVANRETEGVFLYSLGNGQWDIPALRKLIEEIIPDKTSIEAYEVQHDFPSLGQRIMLVNARQVRGFANGESRILIGFQDITEQRRLEAVHRKLETEKDDLLRQKELLLAEMIHRVNNSLSIVASILLMKAQTVQSEETRNHLKDAHGRILAVARVQGQLRPASYGDPISVGSYLGKLCESLGSSMIVDGQPIVIRVDADDGQLTSERAVSLGLIVTELVINSIKHAFPAGARGEILVTYESTQNAWRLTVSDDGIGAHVDLDAPPRSGLGTNILESLSRQLNARITTNNPEKGYSVSILGTT